MDTMHKEPQHEIESIVEYKVANYYSAKEIKEYIKSLMPTPC